MIPLIHDGFSHHCGHHPSHQEPPGPAGPPALRVRSSWEGECRLHSATGGPGSHNLTPVGKSFGKFSQDIDIDMENCRNMSGNWAVEKYIYK